MEWRRTQEYLLNQKIKTEKLSPPLLEWTCWDTHSWKTYLFIQWMAISGAACFCFWFFLPFILKVKFPILSYCIATAGFSGWPLLPCLLLTVAQTLAFHSDEITHLSNPRTVFRLKSEFCNPVAWPGANFSPVNVALGHGLWHFLISSWLFVQISVSLCVI